ncbi:PLP-dependent aspartate aminotransferase family protein [Ignavibacteria bacterium]|nr:cystathionine gamma-synthase [Bacteroidota bacterium]MCZ2132106.1 cystathionine gamma-synthase [Bacteroidota bacterium]
MSNNLYSGFSTKAIHIGQEPDELTGAVTVPLYQTSTYAQQGIGRHKGFEYARTQNPTRFAWEENLAALESGSAAFAFGSGLAAIDAVSKLLKAGDTVVCGDDMYGGTFRLFDKILTRYNINFEIVDMTDIAAVRNAVRGNSARGAAAMIYAETPTNPMMKLCDLREIGAISREFEAIFAVDNTFATPYFQRPLEMGADIVIHSATKYLGGHSDLVSGIVAVSRADIAEKLRFIQNAAGAIPGPFDCWLLLRSVKTMALRMERHAENAMRIANYCAAHPKIHAVHYPGLKSHPQHELAQRQMSGFGGMISIELGSLEAAMKFAESVRVFTLGESLGGVESLVCHPATMTHGSVPLERRLHLGVTDGLVRLSCGIEDADDLLADMEHALAAV